MEKPRFWYIRGLDLLKANDDLLGELRNAGRLERWGHRASIAHREEPGEIHVVLGGGIEVRDPVYENTLRLQKSGLFGVTAGAPVEARLSAIDDTLIAALPREDFEALVGDRLGNLEAQLGIVRRNRLAVPVSLLLYTTPRRRLASVLLHLVETYGTIEENSGALDLTPKTRTLARLTGLADRTVSDIFDGLTNERVVEVGQNKLIIPNLEDIQRLALG